MKKRRRNPKAKQLIYIYKTKSLEPTLYTDDEYDIESIYNTITGLA